MSIKNVGKQSAKEVLNEIARGSYGYAELKSMAKRLTQLVPGLRNGSATKLADVLLNNNDVISQIGELIVKDAEEREIIDLEAVGEANLYDKLSSYPEFKNLMTIWRNATEDDSGTSDVEPGEIKKLSALRVADNAAIDSAIDRVIYAVVANEDEGFNIIYEE